MVCTLPYGSVLCVSATMGFKHRELDRAPLLKALARLNFMIKGIPHVACTPQICELVRYYKEDVTGRAPGPVRPRSSSSTIRCATCRGCRCAKWSRPPTTSPT